VGVRFTGYDHEEDSGVVRALVSEGAKVSALVAGERGALLTDVTPFYAESGGQVGDTGVIRWVGGEAVVTDTTKPTGDLHVHHVQVTSGTLRSGDTVTLAVDSARRGQSRLNHTGTHLLHAALKQVLGSHVMQKGSLVGPDRLRFDFAHHKPVTSEELRRVEDLVNEQILANHAVATSVQNVEEARRGGAMALFGEKYGEHVRVVQVDAFSKELCGGTHARRSGDIGLFKILSESGIAAGVRRIEAQTGPGAHAYVRELEATTRTLAAELRTSSDNVVDSVKRLLEDRARLGRELETLRREIARAASGDLRERAVVIDGVNILAVEIQADSKGMREEADRLREALGSCVIVLAAREPEVVRLLVMVSKDLAGSRYNAGKIVGALAAMVGGKGGGRPDLAQAGGKDPEQIPAMLAAVPQVLSA
jgi:alanyl-tRNA synthetase